MKVLFRLVAVIIAIFSSKASGTMLTKQNTIIYDTEVSAANSEILFTALKSKAGNQTVYLVINSPGGDALAGLQLKDDLKAIKNLKVICTYCASAAALVFAASGVPRAVLADSVLIMHEMYADHVTAKMLMDSEFLFLTIMYSDILDRVMYTVIGMSKEEYEKRIVNTAWILRGKEIIQFHLADYIIHPKCDDSIKTLLPQVCT